MYLDVSDVDEPRLAVYLGLRDHVARQVRERPGGDMAGSFMAEGDLVIERALGAGHQLESVLMDARRELWVEIPDEVAVLRASPEVLKQVSGRPQLRDAIACFTRPAEREPGTLLEEAATVVILDGIVNPTNMGVIMRCAAGLGVDAALLDPTCCDPFYRRAVRVSMGEVFAIPHARVGTLPGGLSQVAAAGFTTVALTPDHDAVDIDSVSRVTGDKLAIVLGTEGPGLSAVVLDAVDITAKIPMAAGVDSINVGSAAAVAFHALRA